MVFGDPFVVRNYLILPLLGFHHLLLVLQISLKLLHLPTFKVMHLRQLVSNVVLMIWVGSAS